MSSRAFVGILLGVVLTFTACDDGTAPDDEVVRLGALHPGTPLHVPDTVVVGIAFDAVVTTWGNGCLLGVARTEVDVSMERIQLTPFDRWFAPRGNVVCTDEEVTIQHVVELVITEAGQRRVTATGFGWPDQTETATLEAWVTAVVPPGQAAN